MKALRWQIILNWQLLWRAELERGSLPILSTKNQLWSLTYLFGGKHSLAKRKKDEESIQLHWSVPWAGTSLLVWKRLLSSSVFLSCSYIS